MNKRLISLSACVMMLLASPPAAWCSGTSGDKPGLRTERKIQLLAEILQARDRGDYRAAVEKLDSLLDQVGKDPHLLVLRQQLAELLSNPSKADARPPVVLADPRDQADGAPPRTTPPADAGSVAAEPPPAPSESLLTRHNKPRQMPGGTDVEALVRQETDRQSFLIQEARRELWYVKRLGEEGRHAEALGKLPGVGARLPHNTLTLPVLQEIAAARIDLEHRQRVSSLNPRVEAPRLAVIKDPAPSATLNTDPLTRRPLVLELHLVELTGPLFEDFWAAWRLFSTPRESSLPQRLHQSILGRTHSLYRPSFIPTSLQQELYLALQLATPKGGNAGAALGATPSLGLSCFIDAKALVSTLSKYPGARVLGSPRWDCLPGQTTHLKLTPEEFAGFKPEDPRHQIGWSLSVEPSLADAGRQVRLQLRPKVTRELSLPMAQSGLSRDGGKLGNAVLASHELQAFMQVPMGATLVQGGLEWQDAIAGTPSTGAPARIPVLGSLLRSKEYLETRRHLLVFVTAQPAL